MAQKINHSQKIKKNKTKNLILNKIKVNCFWLKNMAKKIKSQTNIIGIFLVLIIIIISFFYPQNEIRKIKLKLLINPFNFENHLTLAKKLIDNHQFIEAERALLLAEKIADSSFLKNHSENNLQEKQLLDLKKLWQEKNLNDPQDIQKLIISWEEIISIKDNYRDGYLQLAFLNHKIFETEKALFYLNKALEIDPNFEVSLRLKEIITQP